MIYLDSSALVTMTVRRPPVSELVEFLESHPTDKQCTSTIGFIETVRVCDSVGQFPNLMSRLLRDHTEIIVSDSIRDAAAALVGPLRS